MSAGRSSLGTPWRAGRFGAAGLALVGLLAGAACADYDRVLDILFPPQIDGLPTRGAWAALPIGSWVTEGEVEATAMAACFSRACDMPAAVAAYRVSGAEAIRLDELVADPGRLARLITERDRLDPNARRRKVAVSVSAERFMEGAYRGLVLSMARRDGSYPAVGILVERPRGADRDAVLVIGRDVAVVSGVLRSVLASRA